MTKEEIKELRLKHGLTQSELAELLKCHLFTVQRYEYGTYKTIRPVYVDTLEKIKRGELDAEIAQVKNRKSENKKVEA